MRQIRITILAIAALSVALTSGALTIDDSRTLGTVLYGIPNGDANITSYVDHLIGMTPGTSDSALGQDFTRSSHAFSPLDAPVLAVKNTTFAVPTTANTVTIDLGTGGYMYLFAKYDGTQYGSVVWYVQGLTGTITIPYYPVFDAQTGRGQYGISGTALFNQTSVPDGGTTAMLVGLALSGLGMLRRFLV